MYNIACLTDPKPVSSGTTGCYDYNFWSINLFGEITIARTLAISFYIGAVITCATQYVPVVSLAIARIFIDY